MHSDIRSIARALGGEVSGRNTISIPTPGHSANDRGTVITFDPSAPGGMLVHSFNGRQTRLQTDRDHHQRSRCSESSWSAAPELAGGSGSPSAERAELSLDFRSKAIVSYSVVVGSICRSSGARLFEVPFGAVDAPHHRQVACHAVVTVELLFSFLQYALGLTHRFARLSQIETQNAVLCHRREPYHRVLDRTPIPALCVSDSP